MKRTFTMMALVLIFGITGCAQQPSAATSSEAIQNSQSMPTPEQKADYLVEQANKFLSKEQYTEAVNTAQYVLANVDQNSQKARQALEKARDEMAKKAQESVNDMKKNIENFGK